MRVRIRQWGNSASVRIAPCIIKAAGLRIDQAVDVSEQGGRIVIAPVECPVYDLQKLLSQMTPETFHDTIEFGTPVGNETW